ncbi:hypothetical protein [Microbulbifer sp. S227A]|uniref:hypothetical protein n=1 Tax=Microbulbifer sp. S227A TaxID=3415131 RepID=UPI003C7E9A07
MNKFVQFVALSGAAIFLAACEMRVQPVYNVSEHPVTSVSHQLSTAQVRRVILNAGAQRGWVMEQAGPNTIRATLRLRDHVAVARIVYTSTAFSIEYVNSSNLLYSNGNIHRNYNSWITNLENDIALGLNKASQ